MGFPKGLLVKKRIIYFSSPRAKTTERITLEILKTDDKEEVEKNLFEVSITNDSSSI